MLLLALKSLAICPPGSIAIEAIFWAGAEIRPISLPLNSSNDGNLAKKVILSEGKYDSTSNKKGFGHLKKIIQNEGIHFSALVGVTTQSVDFKMLQLFDYAKNNITKEILTNRVLSSKKRIINFLLDDK